MVLVVAATWVAIQIPLATLIGRVMDVGGAGTRSLGRCAEGTPRDN